MKPKQELIGEPNLSVSKRLQVVAAVIERRGRWLLAQRPLHKAHGGLWEFPGGKVNVGETLAEALVRELLEELALEGVEAGKRLDTQVAARAASVGNPQADLEDLHLHFLSAATESAPIALEHMALGWFNLDEALRLNLAPLDRAFVEGYEPNLPSSTLK